MRVLLLSAYAAQSHRHWQQMLQQMFSAWQWQVLELPPRHFSWRVRGNPLWWASESRAVLEADYDLVIATSMVDVATLRGLVPALARQPTALYFHENQFAYPSTERQKSVLEAQMVSLYSALAAQRLWFNSAWNRESFFAGVAALLRRFPDYVPSGLVEQLQQRSEVLPVPLATPDSVEGSSSWSSQRQGPKIAWLGRFEHDKGPEQLLAILQHLEAMLPEYRLALIGQQFRRQPEVLAQINQRFGHRIDYQGYIEQRGDYLATLAQSDIVLSTALHEFQGLAIQEACALGAVPVLPDRLCYSQMYPHYCLYPSSPDEPEEEARAAAQLIVNTVNNHPPAPDMSVYFTDALGSPYMSAVQRLLDARAAV